MSISCMLRLFFFGSYAYYNSYSPTRNNTPFSISGSILKPISLNFSKMGFIFGMIFFWRAINKVPIVPVISIFNFLARILPLLSSTITIQLLISTARAMALASAKSTIFSNSICLVLSLTDSIFIQLGIAYPNSW